MGRALLAAADMGCVDDVATIAACASVESLWSRDASVSAEEFEDRRGAFAVAEGDLVTYLNVYKAYKSREDPRDYDWFSDLSLSRRALARVDEVRAQLMGYLTGRLGINRGTMLPDIAPAARAVTAGFFANAAYGSDGGEGYRHVRQQQRADVLHVHPTSVLFKRDARRPPWIVFMSSVQTDKAYVRDILAIEFEWLTEMAPSFYESNVQA